jgi:hypothetical protein
MTSPGTDKVRATFRAVDSLLGHRDMLSESLEADLTELRRRLSEKLCPYPIHELEAHKEKLNERFPDYEHWYILCGTTVTWCDKPRKKPDQDPRSVPAKSSGHGPGSTGSASKDAKR